MERLKQFIDDKRTSDAVRDFLIDCFLDKKSGEDIYIKAGRFIAIERLNEAWSRLEGIKLDKEDKGDKDKQIGM